MDSLGSFTWESSSCSSYTRLSLSAFSTPAFSCLEDFTHAVPSAWNAFPFPLQLLCSFNVPPKASPPQKGLPDHPEGSACSSPPPSHSSFSHTLPCLHFIPGLNSSNSVIICLLVACTPSLIYEFGDHICFVAPYISNPYAAAGTEQTFCMND